MGRRFNRSRSGRTGGGFGGCALGGLASLLLAALSFGLRTNAGFLGVTPFLLLADGVQGALTRRHLVGGQAALGARDRARFTRRRRCGSGGPRPCDIEAAGWAFGCARRIDAPTLGLHHHCLGASVTEALLDRAGVHGAAARLQRERSPLTSTAIFVVVPVAHSTAE